ncbi:MAG TPA: hypothetical protein VGL81_35250 [Polyangiaceae bacterium]|jgi:hypothetical protein
MRPLALAAVLLLACAPYDPSSQPPPAAPAAYGPPSPYAYGQPAYPAPPGYPGQAYPPQPPPAYPPPPAPYAVAPPAPLAPYAVAPPEPLAPYAVAPPALPPAQTPPAPLANGDPHAAARQRCVTETNAYRAKVGAAPVVQRPDQQACADQDAAGDAANGTVHGGSGHCGWGAQNECPDWPGTPDGIVTECLASMFREGPGEPYAKHGHYINMTSAEYRGLACGFHEQGGHVWLIQNYYR